MDSSVTAADTHHLPMIPLDDNVLKIRFQKHCLVSWPYIDSF